MEVSEYIFLFAQITGVIAFSVSGTLVGISRELDLFGVLIVGTITAVGGGCLRDIMLGSFPPQMFRDPIFTTVAAVTSVRVMLIEYLVTKKHGKLERYYEVVVNIFDAIGLGVFLTVGVDAAKHAGYGDNVFLSVFVATISGVGGSITRDVLVNEVPRLLKKQIYILPAIFGSLLYYYLSPTKIPEGVTILLTVIPVVSIRVLAATFRWDLPHFKNPDRKSRLRLRGNRFRMKK